MRPIRIVDSAAITLCGKGTFNGPAAEASQYAFAPCILPAGHPNVGSDCDSGPVDEPPRKAA